MIEYTENVIVKLDGKVVGTIKEVPTGYQYFPKGSKTAGGGVIFATLGDVKYSLEG